jgi:general secretion pathway protein G
MTQRVLNRDRRRDVRRAGFTLIELMVVIVILGLLAGLVGPRIFRNVDKANVKTAMSQIELLGQGLDSFRLDTGRYPTTSEGLEALQTDPGAAGWDGPYLKKGIPKDPWKQPYVYRSPGQHGEYELLSYGKDKAPGGDGYNRDITSWENLE